MKHNKKLTFKNGSFVLLEDGNEIVLSIKAALVFKSYSDDIAQRVFNRVLVKRYTLPDLPPLPFLDDHQLSGVRWILSRSRSYLAHAPGAGKTVQAIAAAYLSGSLGKTLFIVPPSLVKNWEREIYKFMELLNARIYPSILTIDSFFRPNKSFDGPDFTIVSDSMLSNRCVSDYLSNHKHCFVAVDEASRFKEPSALRSRIFYGGKTKAGKSFGLFQNAKYTVFLDGSPMPNRPMELWAPTFALAPEAIDFMGYEEFGNRYCAPRPGFGGATLYTGASHQDELKQKLQKNFMHVVGEDELNHPERLRSILFMDKDTRPAEVKTWEQKHLSDLTGLTEGDSQGDLARMRRLIGLSKVPWIVRYVNERLQKGNESILLFAWHREVCEELHQRITLHGHRTGLVMGGTPNSERETTMAAFQSGSFRVIVGNIQAMGRGHNLQRADRVIFGEYSWTDELNKQCEKRASRRGRNASASVRCEYIAVPNSMDEIVLQSNFTKAKNVKRIIG